jgi:arginine decarboxylase
MNQKLTPYFTALLDYSKKNRIPFDVPGHKMGLINDELVKALGKHTLKMDVNTPDGLDNLNVPYGVIKEAQSLFSEAFQADRTFFLTGGTTIGILSIIMATVRDNEKIIMPRNVHKSIISALIISGAIPVFVEPMIDAASGIANHMPLEAFKKAVDDNLDAKAVLIINPTYFGVASDLKSMVEYAHNHNIIVLADEAHGSHMVFHDSLPLTAMQAGADLSATSIHKTSGSLTQSSAILAKGNRIDYQRLIGTIHMVQSTSPSSLMLASLDVARKHMYHHANEALTKLFPVIDSAIEELNAIDGIHVLTESYFKNLGSYAYDKTKIIIDVSGLGLTGFEVYKILSTDFNIQLELAEANVVLCVLSIATTKKHLKALIKAFGQLSKSYKKDKVSLKLYQSNGHPVLHTKPRTAYNAPSKVVPYKDSIDQVAAGSVMIYPPGIPILIPGEIISAQIIEDLIYYVSQGSTVLSEAPKGFIKIIDKDKFSE